MTNEFPNPLVLNDFSLGRVTSKNHTNIPRNALLVAKNILLQGGGPTPIPGYKKVQDSGLDAVERMHYYERQTDDTEWLVATGGTKIRLLKIDGSAAPVVLSDGEVNGDFSFLESVHSLYMGNGANQWKMINVGGNNVLVKSGLDRPTSTPTIDIGAGTLSLDKGRQYVYCEVHRWTDSQGTARYHISAPSDISAHTGVLVNNAVTLGSITQVNAETTHFWIFGTQNALEGTQGDYYFIAEIPVAATEYVDEIPDSGFDTTRIAPWDNQPPPLSNIMLDYGGRAVMLLDDKVYLSALEEIALGIPYECFPVDLTFTMPAGSKKLTCGIVYQELLYVSTEDYWSILRGNNLDTFDLAEKKAQPGAIGKDLAIIVRGKLVWLGKDKKLWTWTGIEDVDPVPASAALHAASETEYSMDDMSEDYLSKAELRWYTNGLYDIVVLAAASKDSTSGEKDWIQVWDLTPITGVLTIQGPIPAPAETDFFPAHDIRTTLVAKDSGISYIYLGADDGSIYRWPDGWDFDGQDIEAAIGTPWLLLSLAKVKPKLVKLYSNTDQSKDFFQLFGNASNGVRQDLTPIEVPLEDDYSSSQIDPTKCQGYLNRVRGLAWGNWVKLFVKFPEPRDTIRNNATLDMLTLSFEPTGKE